MSTDAPPRRPPLPNKLFFRIGEVAEHTGIQPYTLRYWEKEFPTLRPKKNEAGQRSYRAEDIEMVLEIERLLIKDGYTAAGARRRLGSKKGKPAKARIEPPAPLLMPQPESAPESRPSEKKPSGTTNTPKQLAARALALMEETDAALARLGVLPEEPGK